MLRSGLVASDPIEPTGLGARGIGAGVGGSGARHRLERRPGRIVQPVFVFDGIGRAGAREEVEPKAGGFRARVGEFKRFLGRLDEQEVIDGWGIARVTSEETDGGRAIQIELPAGPGCREEQRIDTLRTRLA